MSTLPVQIDPVTPVTAMSGAFGAAVGGPWQFGGNFFVAVGDPTTSSFTAIYKSIDGGLTWTQLDSANQPVASGVASFDGDHTIVSAYNSQREGNDGPIFLQNFDLATETWGAPYGTVGSPDENAIFIGSGFVGFRPDGSIFVLYQASVGLGPLQFAHFFASFSAGVWGTPLQVDTNYTPFAQTNIGVMTAAVEATGAVHVFLTASHDGSGTPWNVFYQEVTPGDTLGAFFTFPDNNNGNLICVGVPAFLGGKIFLPAFVSDAGDVGYFWGIRDSWPAVVGPIDPGLPDDPTLLVQVSGTSGFAAVFGGTLTFVYVAQGSDTDWLAARMRLLQTTSLDDPSQGWTGTTVTDVETYPPDLLPIAAPATQRILGIGPLLPGLGNVFNMFQPASDSFLLVAFFFPIPFNPGPTFEPARITLRGVKRSDCIEALQEAAEIRGLPHVKRAL